MHFKTQRAKLCRLYKNKIAFHKQQRMLNISFNFTTNDHQFLQSIKLSAAGNLT